MIPYGRQQILESDIDAVNQALRKDLITTGSYVEEFEQKLTDYVSCPTFVVNSGTAALHAAYWGADIGPGDEIITPANTFIATQAAAAVMTEWKAHPRRGGCRTAVQSAAKDANAESTFRNSAKTRRDSASRRSNAFNRSRPGSSILPSR